MSFLDLAGRRQSVRRFLSRPVERPKLERCLEAARLAPSASNAQPWHFVVADEPALVRELGKAGYNRFTRSVPAFAAVVREPEHFCLQAAEEGLGTCMLGMFNQRKVKRLLGVGPARRVEILIALGYPADAEIREKNRKALDRIRSYNRYGGPRPPGGSRPLNRSGAGPRRSA
jgi:nitroreductase